MRKKMQIIVKMHSHKPMVSMWLANLECKKSIFKGAVKAIIKAQLTSRILNKCMELQRIIGISSNLFWTLSETVTVIWQIKNKDSFSSAKLRVYQRSYSQTIKNLITNYKFTFSLPPRITSLITSNQMDLLTLQQRWEIQSKEENLWKIRTFMSVTIRLTGNLKWILIWEDKAVNLEHLKQANLDRSEGQSFRDQMNETITSLQRLQRQKRGNQEKICSNNKWKNLLLEGFLGISLSI